MDTVAIEHPAEGYWKPGVPQKINGLSGWWFKVAERYVYADHGAQCPVCGGCGFPWLGWFSCECCSAVAFMPTGEVLVRAVPERRSALDAARTPNPETPK